MHVEMSTRGFWGTHIMAQTMGGSPVHMKMGPIAGTFYVDFPNDLQGRTMAWFFGADRLSQTHVMECMVLGDVIKAEILQQNCTELPELRKPSAAAAAGADPETEDCTVDFDGPRLGLAFGAGGVVTAVMPSGEAAAKGMRPGDVIARVAGDDVAPDKTPSKKIQHLQKALSDLDLASPAVVAERRRAEALRLLAERRDEGAADDDAPAVAPGALVEHVHDPTAVLDAAIGRAPPGRRGSTHEVEFDVVDQSGMTTDMTIA